MTNESAQLGLLPQAREDLIERLDDEILWLLTGRSGGPLDLTPTDDEKAVLRAIRYRRGAGHAMPIRELQEITKLDVRAIKQTVRSLRCNFHLPVGSSKNATAGGYFLMITPDDVAIWRNDVISQVRAEVSVLRAAAGRQTALEMLGQLQMEEAAQETNDV